MFTKACASCLKYINNNKNKLMSKEVTCTLFEFFTFCMCRKTLKEKQQETFIVGETYLER
jgi:hypothetical protein